MNGRATLGDAFAAANPALARELSAVASQAQPQRRDGQHRDRRGDVRGERRPKRDERQHVRGDHRTGRQGQRTAQPQRTAIVPRNADPADPRAVENSRRAYVELKRGDQIRKRQGWAKWRRHELDREDERRDGKAIPQQALKSLGRLVILSNSDVPSNLMIAAAWPGDHSGLVCAYLDSDLFNEHGWFFEPDEASALSIADFGVELRVFPRDGAWTFRSAQVRPKLAMRKAIGFAWSDLDVGASILHRRFKTDIEEGRKSAPKAEEIAAVIPDEPGIDKPRLRALLTQPSILDKAVAQ